MKKKTMKRLMTAGLVVTAVGGLVHLLQPFGIDILSWFGNFGGFSNWIQGIAGAVTLLVAYKFWK